MLFEWRNKMLFDSLKLWLMWHLHLPDTHRSAMLNGNYNAAHFCHQELKSQEQLNHVVHKTREKRREAAPWGYLQTKTTWSIFLCNCDIKKGNEKQLIHPRYLPEIKKETKRGKSDENQMSYRQKLALRDRLWLKQQGATEEREMNTGSFWSSLNREGNSQPLHIL